MYCRNGEIEKDGSSRSYPNVFRFSPLPTWELLYKVINYHSSRFRASNSDNSAVSYMSRHIWNVPGSWLDGSYWKVCYTQILRKMVTTLMTSFFYHQRRFAQNFLMTFAFFTSRLPFLLLYLRLFGSDKMTRYGVYIGGIAVSLVYLVYIPLIPIFCAPGPGRNWGSPEVFAKCTRIIPYALVYGVGNIVLDLYILLLPMPMIWRLKLPFEKKLGVSVLFTTGAL